MSGGGKGSEVGAVVRVVRVGFRYLRPYWREHIILALTAAVPVTMGICLPLSLKVLIDKAIVAHHPKLLADILAGLATLLLLSVFAEIVQVYVRAQFGSELKKDLRLELFSKLQELPMSYFDSVEPGELTALFANEIITLRNAWRNMTIKGGRAVLQLLVTVITMIALDAWMTAVLVLIMALTLKVQRGALEKSEVADYEDKMADAKVAFAVQDNVMALPMLRAFGLGQQAVASFTKDALKRLQGRRTLNTLNRAELRKGFKSPTFIKSMVVVWANVEHSIIYFSALSVGAWLCYQGTLTVGTFTALLALFVSLGQAISNLSAFFQDLISAASALARIEMVLQLRPEVTDGGDAVDLPQLDGRLAFQGVSFGYGQQLQVKDITFELPSKCAVAIVGRSGCGKSTLMKLMLRFYDPREGVVSLDGHDLSKIRLDSLRGQVGVVLQEPALFNGSVRANIAITKPEASLVEVEAAAKAAEVHEDIVSLPSGYETSVGEGGKRLSLGQRQRIALARALLRDPSVLILDEITSALDPESESAIQTTLRRLARKRTVVMLTHRLSSASHAERILVVDQGRLVQQGRHHSLLQEEGLYRKFWQLQSGFVVSQDGRRAQVTAERLQSIPLFAGIEADVLTRLAGCFLTEYFELGDSIYAEGEVGDRFFIIVRGRIRVMASSWDHSEAMQVALLEDGDYFGEESMLEGNTYTTGVEVEVPTLVLFLRRRDFKQMLKTTQRVRQTMEETALARCLTLIGRRGRGPLHLSAWDAFVEPDERN